MRIHDAAYLEAQPCARGSRTRIEAHSSHSRQSTDIPRDSGTSFPASASRWSTDSIATWYSMPAATTRTAINAARCVLRRRLASKDRICPFTVSRCKIRGRLSKIPGRLHRGGTRRDTVHCLLVFRARPSSTSAGRRTLLIGGTASVVGEDSRHAGQFDAQVEETLLNLEALIQATSANCPDGSAALHRLVDLRVYVTSASDAERVRELLVNRCPRARTIAVALAQSVGLSYWWKWKALRNSNRRV